MTRQDGVLSHTNHFILKETKPLNPKIGVSSQIRSNRIEKVLGEGSFTRGTFIAFTKEKRPTGQETIRSVAIMRGNRDQASGLSLQPFSICPKRVLLKYGWPWASPVNPPLKNDEDLPPPREISPPFSLKYAIFNLKLIRGCATFRIADQYSIRALPPNSRGSFQQNDCSDRCSQGDFCHGPCVFPGGYGNHSCHHG